MRCNACGQKLIDPRLVQKPALRGIECAFQAHCGICIICINCVTCVTCDLDTWAVLDDPAAFRTFHAALEKAMGQKAQLETAKPELADDGNAQQLE